MGADVVHDLNCIPWPFADDTFEEVHAYDVLEHLEDVVRALEEIHRVSRHGATVHVTVPHFSSANAFTDVTHRHWFGCAQLRSVPRFIRRPARARALRSREVPPFLDPDPLSSFAGQQADLEVRQSLAARLRASLGLDVPCVVHVLQARGAQAEMRVVHIVPALFGPDGIVGGAERYAFELARHMAARVPTTLVTFGDRDRHETRGAARRARAWQPLVRPGPAQQSVPCPAVRGSRATPRSSTAISSTSS